MQQFQQAQCIGRAKSNCARLIQKRHLAGFSLVGSLIVLFISTVVMAAFLQTMLGSSTNNKLVSALAQIQNNSRMAIADMKTALTYRGFEGCRQQSAVGIVGFGQTVAPPPTLLLSTPNVAFPITDLKTQALRGYTVSENGTYSPSPDPILQTAINALTPEPVGGSDVLVVYHNSSAEAPVAQPINSVNGPVRLTANSLGVQENDYVFVGNCLQGAVFNVANNPGNSGAVNLTPTEGELPLLGTDTVVRRAYVDIYYIGDSGRRNPANRPIYALFRARNGQVQELTDGLVMMKIDFGENMPGGGFRYQGVGDINATVAEINVVKVGFLAASGQLALQQDDMANYQVLGELVTPGVHHQLAHPRTYKKVFAFNIAIING